ncbi:hypothetical protein GC101_27875 [Paenibacillus sp. LMG 31459]|uniref:Uncharacterized protein n=1 Tax=Paenibacillus phytohabitans TaxID=2654978 RepID=A0ABX1YSF6_9BACL|nr:hypothetical protein [Paenibacillus phytohabitans]
MLLEEAIIHRYKGGMSTCEVAKFIGLPESLVQTGFTVDDSIHRTSSKYRFEDSGALFDVIQTRT